MQNENIFFAISCAKSLVQALNQHYKAQLLACDATSCRLLIASSFMYRLGAFVAGEQAHSLVNA